MITFKQFMAESINDKGIFKAIFVIGLPGAGKSYTVKRLKGPISPVVINTDKAAEYLGKKLGIKVSSETWKMIEDKTHRMTKGSLKNYVNGMLPLFVDGTSNDASNILHRMGILESLGYDVGIVHVYADLETAKKHAKEREAKIGRVVDPEFIELVNSQSHDNASFLKSKVGFFREIKNTSDRLDDEEMLKAFKATQAFFASPVKNPVGKRAIQDIIDGKEKYLVPLVVTDEELDNKIQGWYR